MRTLLILACVLFTIGCGARAGESVWIQKQNAPDGTNCYVAYQADAVVGFSCVR